VKFNDYLLTCREENDITQEKLVQELYSFDDSFAGLDINTYSRWERGVTQPSSSKQLLILKLFQNYSTDIFPCFLQLDDPEHALCNIGIKNLIGHSKSHILSFPMNVFKVDNIRISHIRSHIDIDLMLNMPQKLIESITDN